MHPIEHETQTLPLSDGTELDVYVARPVGSHDRRVGILVFQEIWGVNEHIKDVCDRLARAGYTAAAPDVFHRTAPRFSAPYTDFSGMQHAQAITPEGVRLDVLATHGVLTSALGDDAPITSIGFCMGGRLSWTANALLPLRAAICFYGGGIATSAIELASQQKAPVLLFWGGKDKHITREHRHIVSDALSKAGKNYIECNFGHADHGFFCDKRASYHPNAAKEAWGLVLSFLAANTIEE